MMLCLDQSRWPDHFALYDDGKKEWYWGPNVQVSFNRPYGKYCQILDAPLSTGSGEFMLWEFPLAHWMGPCGGGVTIGPDRWELPLPTAVPCPCKLAQRRIGSRSGPAFSKPWR